MNRDIRKIILIDDDENASKLFPRNTLLVKPYIDVFDKSDRILYDLIPLLQAMVHEQPDDFIEALVTVNVCSIDAILLAPFFRFVGTTTDQPGKFCIAGLEQCGSNLIRAQRAKPDEGPAQFFLRCFFRCGLSRAKSASKASAPKGL